MLLVNATADDLIFQSVQGETTYADFLAQLHLAADKLTQKGCVRAAIFSENSPLWVTTLYAVWQAKSVAVPVDAMSTSSEVAYILDDCTPSVLFCSEKTALVAKEAIETAVHKPQLIVLESFLSCTETTATEQATSVREVDAQELALIVYTSGTTGSPKGVMLTFGNLEANITAVRDTHIYEKGMRVLIMLPCHHVLPLVGTVISTIFVGGTCVFTPSLQPTDIMATLQEFHVTFIVGVPRFWTLLHTNIRSKIDASALARTLFKLAKVINNKRFSRLIFGSVHRKFGGQVRRMICGGAPIDAEVVADFHTLGFEMLEGYGMTETAPIITFPRIGMVKFGACGQPLPGNEVKIVDGEVLTRGLNVTPGYYNRPEETAKVIKDGWLHTGDLGEMDKDGYLRITGRKKEIIVLDTGKKVNPAEIEQHLISDYEGIEEVGVFSVGSSLEALIYVQPTFEAMYADNLSEHIRETVIIPYNKTVAPYRKIADFILTKEELPKTRIGKLRRFQLPEEARRIQQQGSTPSPDPDLSEYRMLSAYMEKQVRRSVRADEHMATELGIDSLGRVELMVFLLDTFGVNLTEQQFEKLRTLRHLAEHIHQTKTMENQPAQMDWGQILAAPSLQLQLPHSGFMHHILIGLFKLITHGLFRIRVEGMEQIPTGAVIFAPNHQSCLDGIILIGCLKKQRLLDTYFYAKEKHVRKPWLKRLAGCTNTIVVDLNKQLRQSLQHLAAALRADGSVIIFPEGTRTTTGELGEFRPTFAILGKEIGTPIVPVVLNGSFDALPPGKKWPRLFQKITVRFLPPVQAQTMDYETLSTLVHDAIANDLSSTMKAER